MVENLKQNIHVMQHSLSKLIDTQDMQNCLFEPFTIIYNTLKYYKNKKNKKYDVCEISCNVCNILYILRIKKPTISSEQGMIVKSQ